MKITIKNSTLAFADGTFTPIELGEEAFITGTYIRMTGRISESQDFSATDFINIYGARTISAGAIWGSEIISGAAFYDSEQVFISAIGEISGKHDTYAESYTIPQADVPSNAMFVRFSARSGDSGRFVSIS